MYCLNCVVDMSLSKEIDCSKEKGRQFYPGNQCGYINLTIFSIK